ERRRALGPALLAPARTGVLSTAAAFEPSFDSSPLRLSTFSGPRPELPAIFVRQQFPLPVLSSSTLTQCGRDPYVLCGLGCLREQLLPGWDCQPLPLR